MEKPGEEVLQQQQQQQQEALKCPRCDSSNTKFCYYNNYSLSQPRHFCKACKRYWTRGGTLRNVPVGGGCRSRSSNKRLIKRSTTSSSTNFDATNSSPSPTISTPQIDTASTTSNHISPLFYGLSSGSNPCDVNLQFSRFNNNSRISSSGFDFQPQMNATGLGFSSGFISNNNTLVPNYGSIFRSSSSTSASTSIMPSLLSSSNLLQHKFINHMGLKDAGPDGSSNTFQGLASLDQMQTTRMVALKDVKGEGSQNRSMEWNGACQNNQIGHVGLFDPSLYWNTASSAMGVWNDQPS